MNKIARYPPRLSDTKAILLQIKELRGVTFSGVGRELLSLRFINGNKLGFIRFFFISCVVKRSSLHVQSSYFIQLVKGRSGIARIYSRTRRTAPRARRASEN